jgi:hypothetical protein
MRECLRDHIIMKIHKSNFTEKQLDGMSVEDLQVTEKYFVVTALDAYMFLIKRILSDLNYSLIKIL